MEDYNDFLICPHLEARQLPPLFENSILVTDMSAQQDMLLLGIMTTVSAYLPKFYFTHGYPDHRYGANLMTLVAAPPAGGKGILNRAGRLVEWAENIIPGNASLSAFYNELNAKHGHALLFETEADVMSQTLHANYCNYTYLLRQAWEHETVRRARDGKDKQRIAIKNPHLSVLLSGTFNQLQPLLRSQANGLTSRFVTYLVNEIPGFDARVFGQNIIENEPDAEKILHECTAYVRALYEWQVNSDHECRFRLTDEQQEQITSFFSEMYTILTEIERFPIGIDSCMKRLAVNIMRMGMILSAVRLDTDEPFPYELTCNEDDFKTMMLIADRLIYHIAALTDLLPEEDLPMETSIVTTDRASLAQERRDTFFAALKDEFTKAELVALAEKEEIPLKTAERWLKKWQEEGVLSHPEYCKYTKTSHKTSKDVRK